ncbi:hypothetical protein HG536_0A01670 [Torulaspora globosa]|uniref:Uncharacterized protein n=1 Tax=Torulaspora globosa TaxID=48254 RepID=A0A7G3ZA14_9SACH|nr:uncharacterized protein HG536_0A01670 [Torulaspora globosa]QLL30350.1 hypothetical protein HG536_0A01670 [Torulaspora globosa]
MVKSEGSGLLGRSSLLFNFCYIFLAHGVVSGIISGGIEFAIAYGMYYHSSKPVYLWGFPNTLSGDCALTVFIQVGVTWVCEELIVGWDCFQSKTPLLPFEIELPDEASHGLFWRLFEVKHGIAKDELSLRSYVRKQFIRYPSRSRCFNLFSWLLHKFVISMIAAAMIWFWVWPVTMGVMAGVGTRVGSHEYKFHGWAPQIMKLIFGFVIGLMCTPLAIIVILLRDKWFLEYKKSAQTGSQEDEKRAPTDAIENSSGDFHTDSTNQDPSA